MSDDCNTDQQPDPTMTTTSSVAISRTVTDSTVLETKEELVDQWKNRRRMAWVALFAIIAVTICMLFFVPETRLVPLESVVSYFYVGMTSIIGAYIGFATYSDIKKRTSN